MHPTQCAHVPYVSAPVIVATKVGTQSISPLDWAIKILGVKVLGRIFAFRAYVLLLSGSLEPSGTAVVAL